MRKHHRLVDQLGAGFLLLCALSCSKTSSPVGPSPRVALFIEGPSELDTGTNASFKAILRDVGQDTTVDVTQEAAWNSSNPAVLSVDHGIAMGLVNGIVTLQVRFEGYTQAKQVQVTIPRVVVRPSAMLAIEQFSINVYPNPYGGFVYEPRFLLRESSNTSGATIQRIVVGGPSGSDETGPECWVQPIRVQPGGTLDTFLTDAGFYWLSYCAPFTSGSTATPTIHLVVNFSDDNGVVGTVAADARSRSEPGVRYRPPQNPGHFERIRTPV